MKKRIYTTIALALSITTSPIACMEKEEQNDPETLPTAIAQLTVNQSSSSSSSSSDNFPSTFSCFENAIKNKDNKAFQDMLECTYPYIQVRRTNDFSSLLHIVADRGTPEMVEMTRAKYPLLTAANNNLNYYPLDTAFARLARAQEADQDPGEALKVATTLLGPKLNLGLPATHRYLALIGAEYMKEKQANSNEK